MGAVWEAVGSALGDGRFDVSSGLANAGSAFISVLVVTLIVMYRD